MPVITIVGLQFGSVIAFAIITETVFQWPGMGLLFVQAVQNVDIPIMAAYLMLVALIFVSINLAVDILYTVVDPRLRSSHPAAGLTDGRTCSDTQSNAVAGRHNRRPGPARFLDSDVWASFKRSKLTMAAAFLTALFFAARHPRRPCSRRRTLSIPRSSS